MTINPNDVRIFIRPGITDMRKAVNGLTVIIQEDMAQDPFNGRYIYFATASGNY